MPSIPSMHALQRRTLDEVSVDEKGCPEVRRERGDIPGLRLGRRGEEPSRPSRIVGDRRPCRGQQSGQDPVEGRPFRCEVLGADGHGVRDSQKAGRLGSPPGERHASPRDRAQKLPGRGRPEAGAGAGAVPQPV